MRNGPRGFWYRNLLRSYGAENEAIFGLGAACNEPCAREHQGDACMDAVATRRDTVRSIFLGLRRRPSRAPPQRSRARRYCSTLPRWSALTWPYLGRTRRGRLSADAAPWPVDAADVRSSLLPWSGVAICSQSSDGPAHCQCDIATLWHTNSSERNDCAIAACVICIVPCRIIGLCYGPGLRPCTAAAVRC